LRQAGSRSISERIEKVSCVDNIVSKHFGRRTSHSDGLLGKGDREAAVQDFTGKLRFFEALSKTELEYLRMWQQESKNTFRLPADCQMQPSES
jgi:hypothetical protein